MPRGRSSRTSQPLSLTTFSDLARVGEMTWANRAPGSANDAGGLVLLVARDVRGRAIAERQSAGAAGLPPVLVGDGLAAVATAAPSTRTRFSSAGSEISVFPKMGADVLIERSRWRGRLSEL
jgi:hypothetical protein